jgi:hypothetical protein
VYVVIHHALLLLFCSSWCSSYPQVRFKSDHAVDLGNVYSADSERVLSDSTAGEIVGLIGQIGEVQYMLFQHGPGPEPAIFAKPVSSRTGLSPALDSSNASVPKVISLPAALYIFDKLSLTSDCPTDGDLGIPETDLLYRLLWCPKMPSYMGVLPLPRARYTPDEPPADLVAYENIFWALDCSGLSELMRISAHILSSSDRNENSQRLSVRGLLGFRAEFIEESGEPKRYVGAVDLDESTGDILEWPDEEMEHFDIDGPGGEYIIEIEMATAEMQKAIKLRINWGREAYFGEETMQETWDVQRAPEGEIIIGLAVTFQYKSELGLGLGSWVCLS